MDHEKKEQEVYIDDPNISIAGDFKSNSEEMAEELNAEQITVEVTKEETESFTEEVTPSEDSLQTNTEENNLEKSLNTLEENLVPKDTPNNSKQSSSTNARKRKLNEGEFEEPTRSNKRCKYEIGNKQDTNQTHGEHSSFYKALKEGVSEFVSEGFGLAFNIIYTAFIAELPVQNPPTEPKPNLDENKKE